jgi:uncharacterized protein (TIGR02452 family)
MSASYYVLLDKSVLSDDTINNVINKLRNPYEDDSFGVKRIDIDNLVLASNYSTDSDEYSIYDSDHRIKMVCKGHIKNGSDLSIIYDIPLTDDNAFNIIYKSICNNDSFDDITTISNNLNSITGNFSIIAINNKGEYILATDRQGTEKIYIGYIDNKPVLYSNYNISMYFDECLDLDKIGCIIDGYLEMNLKSGKKIQKYAKSVFDNFENIDTKIKHNNPISSISSISSGGVYGMGVMGSADVINSMGGINNMDSLFSGLGGISSMSGNINSMYDNNSALDSAFAPLISDFSNLNNGMDYETRLGKNGTSILDKMICWEDTQKLYSVYTKPIKSLKMYYDNNFLQNYANKTCDIDCKIDIVNEDTVNIAIEMKSRGLNPVVLNMTDKNYPATNIHQGGNGQEESIFRRSNYAQTLNLDTYGLYPINDNSVIYSNNVTIFKDSEINKWKMLNPEINISFIASPPIKSPYNLIYDYTKLFENASLNEEQSIVTKIKLETVFQTAIRMGHNSIVIPAFGCEGHKNPPSHIAKILKELIYKYKVFFKEIIIGMPDIDDSYLGNYRIFKRTFCLETDKIQSTPIITNSIEEEESDLSMDDLLDELEENTE